ncbi:cell wall-binding repeat-containing protein [Euzebya tangerina]|uniref:cell wall-binding repeat-containing protein n=1 Tax=Euzebya tangerina TaxID=591198 RepID=UPI000E31A2F7|nr:cell wall-binding repeat-containing protein [Euzebya tangerina]
MGPQFADRRHRRQPTLVLVLTAAVLVAGLLALARPSPAGAAADDWPVPGASTFQATGEYTDPAGDVSVPEADLIELVVAYNDAPSEPNLVVVLDAVGDLEPETDPNWASSATRATVGFDLDGEPTIERTLEIYLDGGVLEADLMNPATGTEVCDPETFTGGGIIAARFPRTCVDQVPELRMTATMAYQPGAGAVAVDELGDGELTLPLPDEPESPPLCQNATASTRNELTVRRLACGVGGTEPISQAVATSQFVFDEPVTPAIDPYQGDYAVIARDDDFADALTGSSLAFGQGPLLFTYSPTSAPPGTDPGALAPATRQELIRTVPRGRTVYLMGGIAALDGGLDGTLTAMGYEVVRFAGVGREQTARLVSQEVDAKVAEFAATTDFIDTNMVFLATRSNWPDAVVAGSVGAFWGTPILLVDVEPPVHPDTLAALDELRPDYIHAIGGDAVISGNVGAAIRDHVTAGGYGQGRPGVDLDSDPWQEFCGEGNFLCRWGGAERLETGASVAQFNRDMVRRFGSQTSLVPDNPQQYAVGVSLAGDLESNNFAHVLAASTVSGRFGGAVFIVTTDGTITPRVEDGLCRATDGLRFIEDVEEFVMVGDTDLLPPAFGDNVRSYVEGGCPAAPRAAAPATGLAATPL